jgi:membrane dipeptidase
MPGQNRQRALDLTRSSIVIDTHLDTATHLLWRDPEFNTRLDAGHVDMPRLREGGVDAAFFAVWIDEAENLGDDDAALKLAIREMDAIRRTVDRYPGDLQLVMNASEVEEANRTGRLAVLISIEGGRAVASDLGVLRMLGRLGVRSITLAWSSATAIADSHNDKKHGGLTEFGRDVVREMQDLGMLVDLSHLSDEAAWDVLEVATRPVFASHSACRALWDHTRNMPDDLIRATAEGGGVINVNFVANFIGGDPSTGYVPSERPPRDQLRDPFDWLVVSSPEPGPPLSRVIDHFSHAIEVAGPEHVGIGSDFDGCAQLPRGLEDISKLSNLAEGLLDAGHGAAVVSRVLGVNNLELFRKTLR